MEYKCVKFDEKSFNIMEVMAMSVFLLYTFVKFDENSLHFVKVVAEIGWK